MIDGQVAVHANLERIRGEGSNGVLDAEAVGDLSSEDRFVVVGVCYGSRFRVSTEAVEESSQRARVTPTREK